MLKIPSAIESLQQLVTRALTDDAKMIAQEALTALGVKKATAVASPGTSPHLMMSYNWNHQQVILRVVEWLQKHCYLVWVDTEQMKGDTVDAMALAVEGSALMLIGVSRAYKESSNCRMEAQYGASPTNSNYSCVQPLALMMNLSALVTFAYRAMLAYR
jgi:male-specific lethal 1